MATVFMAGSIFRAVKEAGARFERAEQVELTYVPGPAGLLRGRIEAGDMFDLFISASENHARALHERGLGTYPAHLVRNRLCLMARKELGITTETLVRTLLRDSVRLGMSTPGADPSGDYALEFFRKVETVHPGMGERLEEKAESLVGGRVPSPDAPTYPAPVTLLFENDQVDAFLGYATSYALMPELHAKVEMIELPGYASVCADYFCTQSVGASPVAVRFAAFLRQQFDIFIQHGFLPVGSGTLA